MKKFSILITGTQPLLMHNGQLADEFNPIVREIKKLTAKKGTKRTEDDRWELRRLEWVGSLYYDNDFGPYIPGLSIEASLKEAARLTRRGKDVERGVRITSDINPLAYSGPREKDDLYKDVNYVFSTTVGVRASRITRTRPIFRDWAVEAEGIYDPELLDLPALIDFARSAGLYVGLCDWRPRYGTFDAEIKEL